MKYSETGFRAICNQFVAFEMSDKMREFAGTLYDEDGNEIYMGTEEANCILMYGYIDHEEGVSLEVLAMGMHYNHYFFFEENPAVRNTLRIEYAENEEFSIVEYSEIPRLDEKLSELLGRLAAYNVNDNVMETRRFGFLDKLRHKWFVDDVQVELICKGLNDERCWVRIEDLNNVGHFFIGTLLNEPYQDFGYHKGDMVAFFAHDDGEGNIECFANATPDKILTEEDLADGRLLEKAIAEFKATDDHHTFTEVMQLLRDSYVWLPCTGTSEDQDSEQIEKRVPEILMDGRDRFFPVFSSIDAMGEFGNNYSHVQKHMLEVIPMVLNNEKDFKGIVVNMFSEPLFLDKEAFDVLQQLKSRIKRELS